MATLLIIALLARSDNIIPGVLTPAGKRNDMINGQFLGTVRLSAVLTLIVVSQDNVLSAKTDILVRDADIPAQSNHLGNPHGQRR